MTVFELTQQHLRTLVGKYTASGVVYALARALTDDHTASRVDHDLATYLLAWPAVSLLEDPNRTGFPFPSEKVHRPTTNVVIYVFNGLVDKVIADFPKLTVFIVDEDDDADDPAILTGRHAPFQPDAVEDAFIHLFQLQHGGGRSTSTSLTPCTTPLCATYPAWWSVSDHYSGSHAENGRRSPT